MLKDILGLPEKVERLGNVYPVLLKDFEEFCNYSWILKYDKRHTDKNKNKKITEFDALLYGRIIKEKNFKKLSDMEEFKLKIECLKEILKIVLKNKNVSYNPKKNFFEAKLDEYNSLILDSSNYEEFRAIVMRQNIIFGEKIYLNPIVEQAMKDAKEVRDRGSSKITIESMVSTISTIESKHYWDLAEYSYYQILMNYSRIKKSKDMDLSIIQASNGVKVNIVDFSEAIDLNKHPDEGLKKSGKSLSQLSSMLN